MDDRPRVLLTVSGSIPPDLDRQIERGERPRADYRVIAGRLDAEVVDVDRALDATGRGGRVLHRIAGTGLLLAWYAFCNRERFDVVLTDGEQVGLPYAALTRLFGTRATKHAMIVHVLSVPKKARLTKWTRLQKHVDRYLVYSSRQAAFLTDDLAVPPDRVVLTTFMVDSAFFSPERVRVPRRTMICSAGLERRDYPTLMKAVDGLDVEVVIAAASPWSKQPDSTTTVPVPPNVRIERLSLFELRELYASAQFVVMPLVEVDFQAGITTVLEAMAMARPVVCTRTTGQTDTIEDEVTGIYVPASQPIALRDAIVRLLDDQELVDRLGGEARRWVVEHADVDRYADRIAGVIESL